MHQHLNTQDQERQVKSKKAPKAVRTRLSVTEHSAELQESTKQNVSWATEIKLGDPDVVAQWVESQLLRLPDYDEARVIELALYADCHEWLSFLLRAACASDLLRRTTRLHGGSGKRDKEGVGVQSQLEKLAAQFGKKKNTLRTDARIYDRFFSTPEERALAREHCLPREFYVIALASPDPLKAIHYAMEKSADPKFSRGKFREHVRPELKLATPPAEELKEVELFLPKVSIPLAAQSALNEIVEITGKGEQEIIVEAILALRQSLPQQENNEATSALDQPLLFEEGIHSEQGDTQQELTAAIVKNSSRGSHKPKDNSRKSPAKKAPKDDESNVESIDAKSPLLPLNLG
jgi:hypothetical protein